MAHTLETISLADCPLTACTVDLAQRCLTLQTAQSFDLERQYWQATTTIVLKAWSAFEAEVYAEDATGKGSTTPVPEDQPPETFELIQEVTVTNAHVELTGFSKESGAWLTYRIHGAVVSVTVSDS